LQSYLRTSVKHDVDTRLRHSLSRMFSFIFVKALTYSRLKPSKTKHIIARIDVLAFRFIFYHCGSVWYFAVWCLTIAECFASVLLSAPGLATEQVITTEKSFW